MTPAGAPPRCPASIAYTPCTMVYFGKVKDGKIIPEPGVPLVEGARVRIEPVEDGADTADNLAADAVDIGVTEMSEEHDHYASGAPKRRDAK